MREDNFHIHSATLSSEACITHSLVAELVIPLALAGIREHFVRLGAFFEAHLRLGLIPVRPIRVILHRQASIGALDLLVARGFRDAQDFVIVSFDGGHCS